jgi:hypothetical protein
MRRYLIATVSAATCFAIGTAITVAFGEPWDRWLLPGVSTSLVIFGYVVWATPARSDDREAGGDEFVEP